MAILLLYEPSVGDVRAFSSEADPVRVTESGGAVRRDP
jgi:hypothetical protein